MTRPATGNNQRADGLNGVADDRADALLTSYPLEEGAEDAAELCIRRMANRYGCSPGGQCPDPAAHNRDVIDMTLALQAAGLTRRRETPGAMRR